MSQVGERSGFPNAVPIVDPKFDMVPMMEELVLDLNELVDPARGFLIDCMFKQPFAGQRRQPVYCDQVSEMEHMKSLYKMIRSVPRVKQPFAVIAASIISNVDPNEIVEKACLALSKSERDLVCVTMNSIYKPVTCVGIKSNGKLRISESRPQIAPTAVRFLNSKALIEAAAPEISPQAESWFDKRFTDRVLCVNGEQLTRPDYEVLNEITSVSGFYSPDISNGFNRRHGLRDVPCHNDIDDERPLIMRWVSDLAFPGDDGTDEVQCAPGCDCLTCHREKLPDGRMSLCYVEPGKINLSDLKECAPVIFECSRRCGCDPDSCPNRAVQKRWNWNLIVVRTRTVFGWGVRTLDFIPQGVFVCELLGKVLGCKRELEATIKQCQQMGHTTPCNLDAYHFPVHEMLIMDTRDHGNVSTFIEPTPFPNIMPISICDRHSRSRHRIAFFSMRDIYPNEELHYSPNSSFDWDKKLQKFRNRK